MKAQKRDQDQDQRALKFQMTILNREFQSFQGRIHSRIPFFLALRSLLLASMAMVMIHKPSERRFPNHTPNSARPTHIINRGTKTASLSFLIPTGRWKIPCREPFPLWWQRSNPG
jgi:hypothetical protein